MKKSLLHTPVLRVLAALGPVIALFSAGVGLSAQTDARKIFQDNRDNVMILYVRNHGTPTAHGSAFIAEYNNKKYLITNYHVISVAPMYLDPVQGEEGDEIENLSVVRVNEINDIAILTFPGIEERKGIRLESHGASEGETVFALGYPAVPDSRDLKLTITDGLVSNSELVVESYGNETEYIQISTALNSGNSGGPILGAEGKLVGMATASYRFMQSTNLAVPANAIIEEIKNIDDYPRNESQARRELTERFDSIARNVRENYRHRFGNFYAPSYKLEIYPRVLQASGRVFHAHALAVGRNYNQLEEVIRDVALHVKEDEFYYYIMYLDYFSNFESSENIGELIFRTGSNPMVASELYLSARFYFMMRRQAELENGQKFEYRSYAIRSVEFSDNYRKAVANIDVTISQKTFPLKLNFKYEWGNYYLMPSYDYFEN
ncbi:MAG: trypsin-like peptidase domain-containing protein [Leptospiraceae bacterium]|nr:trypsin-like peptidase domain-containing protein [Leptospiraceae bacterium]MCB1318843.1 trypsin-like peptidase domain-containing protein [Leptospiraceae bacterium]